MRLKWRVGMSVTGLGLACVVTAAIGLYFLRTVAIHSEEISGENLPSLGALLEMQKGLGDIRFSTLRARVAVAKGHPAEVEGHWKEREAERLSVEAAISGLARFPLSPAEAPLWEKVRPGFQNFVHDNDLLWAEVRANRLEEADRLQIAAMGRFTDQLFRPLDDLVDLERRQATLAASLESRAATLANRILGALVLAAIVATAVTGVSLVRAQSEMVAAQERLALFVEHAPAAIAMLDRDMRYLAVSRRWALDYRVQEEDLKGRSHYQVFPDIPARWRQIHARCLAGAVERSEADPFPRQDGTVDWVRWEIHPWKNAGGDIGGIMLFSEVITESKQKEEAIRQSEETLRLALDAAQLGTWDWNLKTGQITGNQRLFELFGLPPGGAARREVLLGRVCEADREHVDRSLQAALASRTDFDAVMSVIGPGEKVRFVAARGHGSYDEGGTPVHALGVVLDVTEMRKREDELREALARLKTLSGLLPICMYCKKIRDDEGYWEQVETYITRHSDALFSHGMCPQCSLKYFPQDPKDP